MARRRSISRRALDRLPTDAARAAAFVETLAIPEGPHAGERLALAPFQSQFVEGALDPASDVAVLSVGRGNAKSAISAGLALGALLGVWDRQPRRDVILAGRTRDQAGVAWGFAAAFCTSLPEDMQRQIVFRRSPRLEIEYEGDGGDHVLRAAYAEAAAGQATRAQIGAIIGALLDGLATFSTEKAPGYLDALLFALSIEAEAEPFSAQALAGAAFRLMRSEIYAPPPDTIINATREEQRRYASRADVLAHVLEGKRLLRAVPA